jgi:hypothetical protein
MSGESENILRYAIETATGHVTCLSVGTLGV